MDEQDVFQWIVHPFHLKGKTLKLNNALVTVETGNFKRRAYTCFLVLLDPSKSCFISLRQWESEVINLVFICSVKDGLSKIAPFFSHYTIFDYLELQKRLLVNLKSSAAQEKSILFVNCRLIKICCCDGWFLCLASCHWLLFCKHVSCVEACYI